MTQLFHIETIVIDGKSIAFEEGSATISGAAGYEGQVVPSASGDDYTMRRRIPRLLRMRIQFGTTTDPNKLAQAKNLEIAVRDVASGRKATLKNCAFASMGDVGQGAVDISYNILSPIQWL
jgi:hypothetical protein